MPCTVEGVRDGDVVVVKPEMEDRRLTDCCRDGCRDTRLEICWGVGDLPLGMLTLGKGMGEGNEGEGRPELSGE